MYLLISFVDKVPFCIFTKAKTNYHSVNYNRNYCKRSRPKSTYDNNSILYNPTALRIYDICHCSRIKMLFIRKIRYKRMREKLSIQPAYYFVLYSFSGFCLLSTETSNAAVLNKRRQLITSEKVLNLHARLSIK